MICVNCGEDRFGGTLIGADFYCPICIAPLAKAFSPIASQETITQLRADNEALRKDLELQKNTNANLEEACRNWSKRMAAAEAKCERIKPFVTEILMARSYHGDAAGLKCENHAREVSRILSEPPST